jgi:hypothetical protein
MFFSFSFYLDTGIWAHSLRLASEAVYNLSHTSSCFCFSYLSDRVSHFAKRQSFFVVHLFTCAYVVWVISPPCPPPPPFPPFPPQFQASPVLPLWLILLKKRHMHNKKDKAFLLVELRIAIQKDSYCCSHVPMCYDLCWFNSNWSLHWFLIPC